MTNEQKDILKDIITRLVIGSKVRVFEIVPPTEPDGPQNAVIQFQNLVTIIFPVHEVLFKIPDPELSEEVHHAQARHARG
jgi:hypothetical protein